MKSQKTIRTVSVFGSTGSVGQSTIELLKYHSDLYQVEVLTAYKNASLLADQAIALGAKYAVIGDETKLPELKEALKNYPVEAMGGRQALLDMAEHSVDWVMMAIVGMAGLEPIFKALPNGKTVAIANKEPLVAAGHLLMSRAEDYGTTILPVDSEHNAIFQVFEQDNRNAIEKIILTASGGPFRTWSLEEVSKATPEQAVKHPNWSMGAKISVDSASMMNKGLEIIEAHHLFKMEPDKIDVVIHPQSIVHSMVQYHDGSVLAQMGTPDMKTPIVNALGYPDRIKSSAPSLDIKTLSSLTFEQPDLDKFPALRLSYQALREGGVSPLVLNATNEVAVAAFLNRGIPFLGIVEIVERALNKERKEPVSTLEEILFLDQTVRDETHLLIHETIQNSLKQVG